MTEWQLSHCQQDIPPLNKPNTSNSHAHNTSIYFGGLCEFALLFGTYFANLAQIISGTKHDRDKPISHAERGISRI